MNEFQQQILQKIEQIASKLQIIKLIIKINQWETRIKKSKIEYLEEERIVTELENNKLELSEKSQRPVKQLIKLRNYSDQ